MVGSGPTACQGIRSWSSRASSAASQGAIALLLLTHHARIWHLVALAALNGASSAFFFPASQGVIPQVVSEDVRQQANALLRLALNVALIGGSAFGGFLVAAVGSGWTIAFDAATFGLARELPR